MSAPTQRPLRTVRSFVRRQSRISDLQVQALEQHWAHFGIESRERLDFAAIFGRQAPINLEIGFGGGENLLAMAAARPDEDFLGIEVHRPGAARVIQGALDQGSGNIRMMIGDAVELLETTIPDDTLANVYLFFPDPWHKKKHTKRRIVQAAFVNVIARKLRVGGCFHLATDWEDYAKQMLQVLNAAPQFRNLSADGTYIERPAFRPLTKFERRGLRLGHGVWDLAYTRIE